MLSFGKHCGNISGLMFPTAGLLVARDGRRQRVWSPLQPVATTSAWGLDPIMALFTTYGTSFAHAGICPNSESRTRKDNEARTVARPSPHTLVRGANP